MSYKNTLRHLNQIFDYAISAGDHRLALQTQIALSKHYAEEKKSKTLKRVANPIQNLDLDALTEDDLIKLIQKISLKLAKPFTK